MINYLLSLIPRKPGVKINLVDCRLRDVGYWRFFFHRNLLAVVWSHAGGDKVQIIPVGGVIDHERFLTLQHLAGDHVAAARFLPGDEPVQLISVDSYVKHTGVVPIVQGTDLHNIGTGG